MPPRSHPVAKAPSRQKPRRLSDQELMRHARRWRKVSQLAKRLKAVKEESAGVLLEQLDLRGEAKVTIDITTITRAQAKASVVYDGPGLYKALRPGPRRAVYTERIDLNLLPVEQRERIYAALTTAERRAVTSFELRPEALQAEIERGRIDAALVKRFATLVQPAPYIVVTDAA